MESIWNNTALLEARREAKMLQDVAAGFLEITPTYLSMLENGKKQPSQKLIARMAALYSQPVTFFLIGEKVKLSA